MEIPTTPETVALASAYAERILGQLKGWGQRLYRGVSDEVLFQAKISHANYAMSLIERYACMKTFFIRDKAVPLYDFYVPAALKVKGKRVPNATLHDVLRDGQRAVVTGVGGSGKTIFMRHLILASLVNSTRIPIFVELRDLEAAGGDIHQLILAALKDGGLVISDAFYRRLVSEGGILFLLDGFDEVAFDARKSVEKQIERLIRGTDCAVIVSSRPDSRFGSWQSFSVVQINTLSLADACQLISKVPFEPATKSAFIAQLKGGMFRRHETMLSNPLLLSIMLLTYSESASIPNRISTFYQLAYEALFHRHDALKFGFKRSRKTDLDISQFSSLFSAFCLLTYDERKFKFDRQYAVETAAKACRIANVDVQPECFVDDVKEAACLLIEEGLELSFTHRSFQEYFVARFISSIGGDKQAKLIRKYADQISGDSPADRVLDLLYEINPSALEEAWLKPELSKIFEGQKLTRPVSQSTWYGVIKKSFKTLALHEGGISAQMVSSSQLLMNAIFFAFRNCVKDESALAKTRKNDDAVAFARKYMSQGIEEIPFSTVSANSQAMKDLAAVAAPHSKEGLELVRQIYLAMLARSKESDAELNSILA